MRRGFFRGDREERRSSKKQNKLQQQEQYQHQKRLSSSQASASASNDLFEPPLGLSGRSNDPSSLRYEQSTHASPQQQMKISPPRRLIINNDVNQIHQNNEQQYLYQQYHTTIPDQSEHPSQPHLQAIPPSTSIPPSQPIPPSQQEENVVAQNNITLTVDNAISEIWRCETDDFRSASQAIQLLRLAIVAEWESQQMTVDAGGNDTFTYEPSDTFLSLQGATLRFHARFESMKAERRNKMSTRERTGDNTPLDSQPLNGVEWELTEQAAWEVWEESIRASSALTHSCVGPSWRRQLALRRQLIREMEMRQLLQPQLQHPGRFADNISVDSSAGEASGRTSLLSMDISNPQSSSRLTQGQDHVMAPPVWQPHRDILEMLSLHIPQVLPAAMIRFASSVIETSIPPLRSANTKVYWDADGLSSGGNEAALLKALGQHLQDERRWLRRRKRLGDLQRDLAFGLFCGGNENEENAEAAGHRAEETEDSNSESKWSIPGAHTPVAVMIHSWLDTCQAAWPFPRELFEGGRIPYHIEEVSNEQRIDLSASEAIIDASPGSEPPPIEIVLPATMDATSDDTFPQKHRKYSLWGDVFDYKVDWFYTLQVLRDCSDLVATGWHPPPSGQVGEGIILQLISIAKRGITPSFNVIQQEMPIEEIQKEYLVACSCASESLVAIKTLASRDMIPHATLRELATSLCILISAAESSLTPVSSGSEKVREFVASNSADILWLLLSNDKSVCPTTDALFDAIDMDLHCEITDENRSHVEECVVIAIPAIRALSAAMWGDVPSVKGVPLLRFFWEPGIDLLGTVASTFFLHNGDAKFVIAGHETFVINVDDQEVLRDDNLFLKVVHEIILAFQRLVESEMVYGSGDLCATEWESFVRAIDVGVCPWLVCRSNGSLVQAIRGEAIAIFSQVTSFLAKCSQAESGVHPIVDDEARNYFHLFLLRKAAPLIRVVDSFSKPFTDTTLALAAIQSWCVCRYLPYKEGDWSKRASALLAEAFVVPKSQQGGGSHFIGGYLHDPLVRLEALKSLVNDDSAAYTATRDSDSVSGISTITPLSMKSGGNSPPAFSLFSLTKNLRELHLVLVNNIILPRLEETLSNTLPKLETTECQPNEVSNKISNAECFDLIEKEFLLRRFAVKMLGMLFRSRTGEAEKRHHFIDLLQNVATSTPYVIREWVFQKEKEGIAEEFISISEFLKGEEMNLRFEAIRQLEICLSAPFSSLPHTHGNIQELLNAISDTAYFYSIDVHDENHKMRMGQTERLLMTLASILPIARLSCARNGQAILLSRHHVTHAIPEDILSFISVDEWLHKISPMALNETLPIVSEESDFTHDNGDMAPFVFVKQYHARKKENDQPTGNSVDNRTKRRLPRRSSSSLSMDGRQGTTVDFEPVVAVIKRVLKAVSCGISAHHREMDCVFDRIISSTSLSQLQSILITICYDVISSFLSHGMAFPGVDDLLWLDVNYSLAGDNEDELVSSSQAVFTVRARCSAVFAGVLGHIIVSHIGDEGNNMQLARRVCAVLVDLSTKECTKAVQHACFGLISILSSLRYSHERKAGKSSSSLPSESYDAAITECLKSFILYVCSVAQNKETALDHLLIPLVDAMREAVICAGSIFDFPKSLVRRTFLILFRPARGKWELQVVAFQCAVAIINVMSAKEASLLMFFAIGPGGKNAKLPNETRIQPLLIDLLRYRVMSSRFLKMTSCSTESNCKPLQVHNRLAHEALSLEMFPVDLDDVGSPKVSAWKCGNVILMLRIGSKDSLYRGWVEVVIRSPCSRIRRLVKWKKDFITEQPESFLPFWEQLHPRPKHESREDDACNTNKAELSLFVESEHSSILANAKKVIARFDSLVSPAESSPSQHHHSKLDSSPQGKSHRNKSRLLKSKSTFGESYGNRKTGTHFSMKRASSDSNLAAASFPTQPETLHERKRSVYSWLQHATGCESIDVDLIRELETLGFSRSSLGVPATVTAPTASYQDLFVHEHLTPFANGPNFYRAISILDRITPFQTHRVALFYGGSFSTKRSHASNAKAEPKTTNDGDKLLMATQASGDFWQFARELGDLVPIRHCKYFSGGLDTSESLSDGSFAFVWFGCQGGSNDSNDPTLVDSMVVFHTVTLMPDRVTNRKRHVGNDVVHIVYGLDIDILDDDHERVAISGQFGFIIIYVIPLVHVPLFKVSVHLKDDLEESICSALDHLVGTWLISKKLAAHFVRNLAMQADVICQSMIEDKLGLVLNTEDREGRIRDTERHILAR